METVPEVAALLDRGEMRSLIADVLGPGAGLVRVLFFDKPPDRSWSLPWHKDRTIAVRCNDLPSQHFHKPTMKAGVPHVEAPDAMLERMLTLRVHLDPMTEANGPLCVISGSHHPGDRQRQVHVQVHAAIGDVLAMRPLLTHCSRVPQPGTVLHRRVIHFEIADCATLPDGYEWHTFQTL